MSKIKNFLISVVIPSYNSSRFLSETIKSVVNQTYKNLEVIIVDDGSIDETEKIVKDWQKKDKRIQYMKHQKNKGPAQARNTGIKNSQGEYIAFLDADDIWFPQKIKLQIEAIEKEKAQGAFSNWWVWNYFDNSKKLAWKKNPIKESKNIIRDLIKRNFGNSSNFILKKRIFDKIGLFDENLRTSEDYDFWFRLFLNKIKIVWIEEPLILYRHHNSQTSLDIYKMRMSRLKVFLKMAHSKPAVLLKYPVLLKKIILLEGYKFLKSFYAKNSTN